MGTPIAWAILSIIHLWWMDEVRNVDLMKAARNKHVSHICGDDALLSTTDRGAARYKQIVRACGGAESEGKHFESRAGSSGVLRGVFLEKLFEFELGEFSGEIESGRRIAAIPVKSLCS
jgi:hypothetical protein